MQSTKFEFLVNIKTAKALGVDIPPTLLALADQGWMDDKKPGDVDGDGRNCHDRAQDS